MDTSCLFHTDRPKTRQAVLEALGKSEFEVKEEVRNLKIWFVGQKHLPEIPSDTILENFLIINKFNLEKCKKRLEMYYVIRSQIPDMYIDKNPKYKPMQEIIEAVYFIPLPKITTTLSRIVLTKLKDQDPEKYNALNYFVHTYNVAEIQLREDVVLSSTLIYDFEGFKLQHLFKSGLGTFKKAAKIFENVYASRVEGIHYINLPSSMQIIVNFAKAVLKEKLSKRIHVHENLESLCKHISKELLPQDYGGDLQPLSQLHELWKQKLKENQELFDHLERLTLAMNKGKVLSKLAVEVDESIVGFGVSDFKNLSLD